MYFTLAVSAATPSRCEALTDRARIADPAVMPVPGPPTVAWRSADGRAALLRWGAGAALAAGLPVASYAGTIWTGTPTPGGGAAPVYAQTTITRVDPVYVAEVPGAVIVSDRAMWAAWTANRLDDHDPLLACALLNPGFPLGSVTPFRGVSALSRSTTLLILNGTLTRGTTLTDPRFPHPAPAPAAVPAPAPADLTRRADAPAPAPGPAATSTTAGSCSPAPRSGEHFRHAARAADVAAALVEAVAPLREAGRPVELSLTGGKDSRLVAAALVTAGVPVRAHTHGFADHPDVVIATQVAERLGIDSEVREPAAPGQEIDVLGRIRATVLVADGMLSAFENVGRPDPAASPAITAGGHGGELLRGGYAETAAGRRATALRAAELLRRLTTRHLGLLRRGAAAGYVASLAPWTAALARGPLQALDDFYLVNRAGRWSAAARQAYLIRESLVQPLFDQRVVLAARAVPLADRTNGALSRAVLADLCPALTDIPLAGKAPARTGPASFDWRRQYGDEIASFLRDYILDAGASGGLFTVADRAAAEQALTSPHQDRPTVWALATLACLMSADYKNARESSPRLPVS
jgi:Asparagine synthase